MPVQDRTTAVSGDAARATAVDVVIDLRPVELTRASTSQQRTVDLVLAAALVIVCAPIMFLTGAAIWLSDRGGVFYSHERVGEGGRLFRCLKFRTMVSTADELLEDVLEADPAAREEYTRTRKLRRDPRVTPVGRVLRLLSLDELPQLVNVLRGDMAVVGPRPVLPAELDRVGERAAELLSVRPGITGLWQVSGRSRLSFEERLEIDLRYVRERTVGGDMRILLQTAWQVLVPRRDRAC